MRRGGGKWRRDSGSPRRTQQRDRTAQQRERGAAPAGTVADTSAVRAAQREGRSGNRARGAALRARGSGASTSRNHGRVTAGRDGRTRAAASAPSRPASLASRSAPRTHRDNTAGQCASLHDLRHREGAHRCGHHGGAGLRTGVVCNPGVCAAEVRLWALPARRGAGRPAATSHREGTTGAGVIGARGQLQVRGPSAVVSAGADLRAPRRADHPAHALGVERGSGRLTRTDRARHAPGAGAPVVVDSMRRHDPGGAGPESSARDSDRSSVGVSGRAGRGGVRLHLVAQSRRAAEDAGQLPWVSAGGCGAYDDVFAQSPAIVEVGCWAHARRYFKEALPTAAIPCAQALALIKQLYGIERAASDTRLDAPARQGLRQEQARPILEKLHAYLAGAAGGGVTKEPARCSQRLRAAQLGRADALRRRRPAQDRQQRGGAGAPADRAWPQKLALRRERSGRPSHRHPVFAGPDLQAPADQSVRVSARCDPARLDPSGAAGPGADATRVEAPAAGFRRTSRRLNGAFLTIRPRLLPVSSISIYVSIGTSDHVLCYWPLDGGDGVGPTLTLIKYFGCSCSLRRLLCLRGSF